MSVRWVPDTCPVKEPPVVTDSIRISQLSAGRMSDKCQVRVSGHLSGGTGGRGSVSRFAAPSLHKAAGTRGLVKRGGGRYGHIGAEAQRAAMDTLVDPTETSGWSDALSLTVRA